MTEIAQNEMIRKIVKDAVSEALQDVYQIDAATHYAHHMAISETLEMASHAKKTLVGAVVKGLLGAAFLGCLAYVWAHKGQ